MTHTGNYRRWIENCFRSFYRPLTYFAYGYLKTHKLAEDIVQAAFLKLLDNPDALESEAHIKNYLYKAVRNACINELTSKSLHSRILEGMRDDAPEPDNDLFHDIVRAEIYGKIIEAIESLPKQCARIFWMSYIEHIDNQAIADALSISINTVKVQKNRAKLRLQKLLKNLYPLIVLIVGSGRLF